MCHRSSAKQAFSRAERKTTTLPYDSLIFYLLLWETTILQQCPNKLALHFNLENREIYMISLIS